MTGTNHELDLHHAGAYPPFIEAEDEEAQDIVEADSNDGSFCGQSQT